MSQTTSSKRNLITTLGLALLIVCAAMCLFPIVCQPDRKHFRYLYQAKSLATGMIFYSADNNDHFPLASRWADRVLPYVKERPLFLDPYDKQTPIFGFASVLSEKKAAMVETPERMVLLYLSKQNRWNQAGGNEDLAEPRRWSGPPRHVFAFVDGHVAFRTLDQQREGIVVWP